ncbi:MAG: hypothetical protein MK066_07495 [Crocinitomicaceae bacterium]|nr:hypothetical protein [Crocinitomicaceae bacterium]
MKKIILLIVALGIVGGLGWYANSLMNTKGKSDTELIDFSIQDVESVDRIIITDQFAQTFEINKGAEGVWTGKNGGCVTQENAEFIIDAIKNIEFKGYLKDNSIKSQTKLIATQHIRVEIFQNGEWAKTWYIGPPAQDHYGQVMLLDSKEYGKSDKPVLMKIKGTNGIIEPRFYADSRKWECTNIFSIPIYDLSKVEIKFNDEPERSFTVTQNGNDFKVYQQETLLSGLDTNMIFRYLHNYKKIHYNKPNYELSEAEVDSVKNTTPFAIMSVTEKNGNNTKLKCFRIKKKESQDNGFVELMNTDGDNFWCELPNGALVKCQYFVFNPLLLGHIYFPMDVSMLETVDGIQTE